VDIEVRTNVNYGGTSGWEICWSIHLVISCILASLPSPLPSQLYESRLHCFVQDEDTYIVRLNPWCKQLLWPSLLHIHSRWSVGLSRFWRGATCLLFACQLSARVKQWLC
jgi:hypothetical protein